MASMAITAAAVFVRHGFITSVQNGIPIPVLMKMLNHSSQAITLRYAGIRDEDSDSTYLNIQL